MSIVYFLVRFSFSDDSDDDDNDDDNGEISDLVDKGFFDGGRVMALRPKARNVYILF